MKLPIDVRCAWCGKEFTIPAKEYNRQLKNGRNHFFCQRACSAFFGNVLRGNRVLPTEKICPVCNTKFSSDTGAKSASFCSRSCASKGSVTDYRREKSREMGEKHKQELGPKAIAAGLKVREAWKYALLKKFLEELQEPYETEFLILNYIFDLALTQKKILVEFDGPYHKDQSIQEKDKEKTKVAEQSGWKVFRIAVGQSSIIPLSALNGIV